MTTFEDATEIVNLYIINMHEFIDTKNYDIMVFKIYHEISYIMALIGYYNMTEQLNLIIKEKKIEKYYELTNIYYHSMLMAVFKNNTDIINILHLKFNFKITEFENIIKSDMKYPNSTIRDMIKKIL